ncbi:hypothetical protein ACVIM8_000730 [Bradyrhizobium sp. USDA 4529]
MNSTSLAGRCGVNWNCSAAAPDQIGGHRKRLGRTRRLAFLLFRSRIDRPLRTLIDRRLLQHVIVQRDLHAVAPLGIAAAPLLGDRVPIGARVLLEGGARLLIFLQLAAILHDRLRRCLRHRIGDGRRQRVGLAGKNGRRAGGERERDKSRAQANQLRAHGLVVASTAAKSARNCPDRSGRMPRSMQNIRHNAVFSERKPWRKPWRLR